MSLQLLEWLICETFQGFPCSHNYRIFFITQQFIFLHLSFKLIWIFASSPSFHTFLPPTSFTWVALARRHVVEFRAVEKQNSPNSSGLSFLEI